MPNPARVRDRSPRRVAVLIVLMFVASAAPYADAARARKSRRPARPPVTAAMVIEVDPLPGEAATAPSAAQSIPAPDAGLSRSTDGLVLQTLPDGSQRVDLRGRFRSYSAVTVGADGSLRVACADDPAAALALSRTTAPAMRTHRPAFGPREE